jgi:hypothetical protein
VPCRFAVLIARVFTTKRDVNDASFERNHSIPLYFSSIHEPLFATSLSSAHPSFSSQLRALFRASRLGALLYALGNSCPTYIFCWG